MKPTEIAAQRIRELRGTMSAEEFGRRMGGLGFPMSRQTVWKVEHHGRPLALDELFAAAYVLGTSPLALVDPGPDESFEVGEGVSIKGDVAGDWLIHAKHPRADVDESRFVASEPPALRAIRDELSEIDEKRERSEYAYDKLAEVFKVMAPEDLETFKAAMRWTQTGEDEQ